MVTCGKMKVFVSTDAKTSSILRLYRVLGLRPSSNCDSDYLSLVSLRACTDSSTAVSLHDSTPNPAPCSRPHKPQIPQSEQCPAPPSSRQAASPSSLCRHTMADTGGTAYSERGRATGVGISRCRRVVGVVCHCQLSQLSPAHTVHHVYVWPVTVPPSHPVFVPHATRVHTC